MHSHQFSQPLHANGQKLQAKSELVALIRGLIDEAEGWIDFSTFMSEALYNPQFGYYSSQNTQIGYSAQRGSDFVTAPELSEDFGRALARSVAQALEESQTDEVWEFGPGTGALAHQLLRHLGDRIKRYHLVELSGGLRARQAQTLDRFKDKVQWCNHLAQSMQGVVIGNEVLDAMPVKLLKRVGGVWYEQGVTYTHSEGGDLQFVWSTRPTHLSAPVHVPPGADYVTEIHPQTHAFMQTLVKAFTRGVFFFIDYGFPEREYYHPQRHMGTVMCHWRHRADDDPLSDVGHKDITAHVDFTGAALSAQEAGAQVLGYTSQANFLINSGLLEGLDGQSLQNKSNILKLINEHEMGELFKVLVIGVGVDFEPLGCVGADRMHTL